MKPYPRNTKMKPSTNSCQSCNFFLAFSPEKKPAMNPTSPIPSIWKGVARLWPKIKLDKNMESIPTIVPGTLPSANPAIKTIAAVGLTCGIA